MAKPEHGDGATDDAGGGTGKYLPVLTAAVVLALAAAAGALFYTVWLDVHRQNRVDELSNQVFELQQLVDQLQRQLDWHEEKINTTLAAAKSPARNAPEEDEVYTYDYDDSDDTSFEYNDDDDETNSKMPVKRTAILGQSTPSNSSEILLEEPVRNRRDVREERGYSHTDSEGVPARAPPVERSPTHHKSKPYPHLHHHLPAYQEQRIPEDTTVKLRHGGKNRNADLADVELVTDNLSGEYPRPKITKEQTNNLLAAHFVGDTSTYNTRDHPHYIGNGIMYHPEGLFKNWLPAPWMLDLDTNTQFLMHSGKIIIEKPGIYFVYAQVYYAATHDRSGFHVKHNGDEVAQCITTTSGHMVKRNTCFTATVLHLHHSDLLWLSEIEGHRNTSFKGSHSFFGLIQLRHTPN